MIYSVKIAEFEGPLDVLLQLVESQAREITTISLMEVTEPFVEYVRENQGKIHPEILADFLMVAARLVYLKSKALLPGFTDPDLEEGPDLETQLKMYKAFVEAAARIGAMASAGPRSFSRLQRPVKERSPEFVPPTGVTSSVLRELYVQLTRRLEPLIRLPQAAIQRVISIEEKIAQLHAHVRNKLKVSFHAFLAESANRAEIVVAFLALLELIKLKHVQINQADTFAEISIELT